MDKIYGNTAGQPNPFQTQGAGQAAERTGATKQRGQTDREVSKISKELLNSALPKNAAMASKTILDQAKVTTSPPDTSGKIKSVTGGQISPSKTQQEEKKVTHAQKSNAQTMKDVINAKWPEALFFDLKQASGHTVAEQADELLNDNTNAPYAICCTGAAPFQALGDTYYILFRNSNDDDVNVPLAERGGTIYASTIKALSDGIDRLNVAAVKNITDAENEADSQRWRDNLPEPGGG